MVDSDTSTTTIGYSVPYQHIARNTPLPPDSEDGETTDTASVGTNRIAQEYRGELEQPIWDWKEEFYIDQLLKEIETDPESPQDLFDEMSHQIPTYSGYSSKSIIS